MELKIHTKNSTAEATEAQGNCKQTQMNYITDGRCCICTGQMLHMHSPAGSTFLHKMMSWLPSQKCDVEAKIQLRHLMHIYLKNIPVKFHPDPIWNDRALGFFEEDCPSNRETLVENTFKPDLRTWLFVQPYSLEAPLRTLFKWQFTNTTFDWLNKNYSKNNKARCTIIMRPTSGANNSKMIQNQTILIAKRHLLGMPIENAIWCILRQK